MGVDRGRLADHMMSQRVMSMKLVNALLIAATGSACGVVAAPCRITSAGLEMVPVLGHPAAAPTDACAEAIDP